jgi:hypothetical protein
MQLSPYDSEHFLEIREGVRRLCAEFPGEYWRELDVRREYPTAFVKALTDAIVKAKPSGAKGKYVQKITLTSSMGPGLKVDLAEVEGA